MLHICVTKNMDRFCNNGLTHPMSAQPVMRRNKNQTQFYNNGNSAEVSQHSLLPCYRQTHRPAEPALLEWNVPMLPELSASYSASQSFVQDLNSTLPPFTTRGYQNGARIVPGTDSFYYKSLSGGFLLSNHPLDK